MKDKLKLTKKQSIIIISCTLLLLVGVTVIGLTYAYWNRTAVQRGINVIESSCLDISFDGENDINLPNAFPLRDAEGMELTPYTFTITNTCDLWANYQINLETFPVEATQKKMNDNYIKANLKQKNSNKFNDTLNDDIKVTPTITGASDAYKLAEGVLKNGKSVTYDLRLWMDEGVTLDNVDSIGASFKSKISVISTAAENPFAESGTIQVVGSSYSEKLWQYKGNITEVIIQNKLEPISTELSWDVSESNDHSVMAYLVPNESDNTTYTLYLQGNGGIKANQNSSSLFANFKKLSSITGLEYFDTSNATNMTSMFANTGYNSSSLTLDLSSFDTSNVTNMQGMFNGVAYKASSFELDLSNFNTSKVTDMSSMFLETNSKGTDFSLNISSFDTSNVTTMAGMFYGIGRQTNGFDLDLSNFNTEKLKDVGGMFASGTFGYNSIKLNVILGDKFVLDNVTSFYSTVHYDPNSIGDVGMFENTNNINIEISIKNNNNPTYTNMFKKAATTDGSQIIVNYTNETEELVNAMIETKSSNSNVIKGSLIS